MILADTNLPADDLSDDSTHVDLRIRCDSDGPFKLFSIQRLGIFILVLKYIHIGLRGITGVALPELHTPKQFIGIRVDIDNDEVRIKPRRQRLKPLPIPVIQECGIHYDVLSNTQRRFRRGGKRFIDTCSCAPVIDTLTYMRTTSVSFRKTIVALALNIGSYAYRWQPRYQLL